MFGKQNYITVCGRGKRNIFFAPFGIFYVLVHRLLNVICRWQFICVLFWILSFAGYVIGGSNAWDVASVSPRPMGGGAIAMVSNSICMFGGSYWDGGRKFFSDEMFLFSAKSREWEKMSSLPVSVGYGVGISLKDGGLMWLGGFQGSCTNTTPSVDCWKFAHGASDWIRAVSLPLPLVHFEAGEINGELIVLGGSFSGGFDALNAGVWIRKKGENVWKKGCDIPDGGRMMFASAVYEGRMLIFCGGLSFNAKEKKVVTTSSAWEYDLTLDQWKRLPDAPISAYGIRAVSCPGRGVLLTGGLGTVVGVESKKMVILTKCYLYDVKKQTYSECEQLPVPLFTHSITSDAGNIWIAGGEDKPKHRSEKVYKIKLAKLRKKEGDS